MARQSTKKTIIKTDSISDTSLINIQLKAHEGFRFSYILFLSIPILLMMALLSHSIDDLNLLSGATGSVQAYENWAGPWGAWIARFFFWSFGLATWPILLMLFLWILRPFFTPHPRRHGYWGAMIVVIFGLTILFAIQPGLFVYDFVFVRGTESLGIGHSGSIDKALSGGLLGQWLAAPALIKEGIEAGVLRRNIGDIGTIAVGTILLFLGLFFIFWQDWKDLFMQWLKPIDYDPIIESEEEDEKSFQVKIIDNQTQFEKEHITQPDLEMDIPTQSNKGVSPPAPPPFIEPPMPKIITLNDLEDDLSPTIGTQTAKRVLARSSTLFGKVSSEPQEVEEVVLPKNNDVLFHRESRFPDESPILPPIIVPQEQPPPQIQITPEESPIIPPIPSQERDSSLGLFTIENNQANMSKATDIKSNGQKVKIIDASEAAPYTLPILGMLTKVEEVKLEETPVIIAAREQLSLTLSSFGVEGIVTNAIIGPKVIRFEIALGAGVNVKKVEAIAQNIAKDLKAQNIRILAPIPGKDTVGVEVPNPSPIPVHLRQVMESPEWTKSKAEIPLVLGKDVSGKAYVADMAKMPHLLIAGGTGAGKSVCMNILIMSMMYRFSPDDLKLIMVDPKVVEMASYEKLPHLITPVVNDSNKVPLALRWGVAEMERRYRVLADARCKNLLSFNNREQHRDPELDSFGKAMPSKLPYLVIIIDELADLMMTEAKKDVEQNIAKIAQKGRAAGIHLIVATQRPSANIVTGVIKANLPTRIAFRVSSLIDSRVILDQAGAEKLLGQGDMLYIAPGTMNPERIQGAFAKDDEIERVVNFICQQRSQNFLDGILTEPDEESPEENARTQLRSNARALSGEDEFDDIMDSESGLNPILEKYLYPGDSNYLKESLQILYAERQISTSYIQRRLKIGYNKAAEIIDEFEKRGIIGPQKEGGSKRDILIFDELAQSN